MIEMGNIVPIGPALPPAVEVSRFRCHFKQLTKDRYGDYTLALGVGKEDKDEAWKLTDYDGSMMEIVVSVIPRIKPTVISSDWQTE